MSTQIALWVLVEYIKEPRLSLEQIAARLREQHNVAVVPESIERFFQDHDLKKDAPAIQLNTLATLRSYQEQLARESSPAALFAHPPTVPFRPAQSDCPGCQAPLQVYKTQRRTVLTLSLGRFTAQETLLHCGHCANDTLYGAESLSQLLPSGCTYGYDVLVFVGRALFLRHRPTEEIIEELRARQVQLSPSEVGYLGRKFVAYLALAHRQSAPGLQQAMRAQGGYILDLDGTTGGGGPMLMSSLDSLSEIVPGNVRRSGNGCASTA